MAGTGPAGPDGGTPTVAPATAAEARPVTEATSGTTPKSPAQPAALGASDKHAVGGTEVGMAATPGNGAAAGQLSVNSAGAAGAADASRAPTLKVSAGVDTPEFGQGLADRVTWMVDNNLTSAKLQVNPPQLGPIEVRIEVQAGNAQVWMTSHSAVTRDALESGTPKLREMLGAQGFDQVSVNISQRSFQERTPNPQPYDWTPSADRGSSSAASPVAAVAMPRAAAGALDTYA